MHKFSILILFFYLSISSIFGQTTNLQSWILKTFPQAELNEQTLYVIDGVPIRQGEAEIELAKYSPNGLSTITYLGEKSKLNQVGCRSLDNVVLISTNYKGSRKWLKENYKKAKELFSETSYPTLMINGERIYSEESKSLIRELKLSQINNITIVTQPVSIDIYGENGTSGLVMISRK